MLEKAPPFFGIVLLIFPVVVSIIQPEIAAYYIIILNVYFLYKSTSYAAQFAVALIRIRNAEQINWREKVDGVADVELGIKRLREQKKEIKSLTWDSIHSDQNFPQNLKSPDKFLFANSKLPLFLQKILFRREKNKTIQFIKDELKFLKKIKTKQILNPHELHHVVIIPHVKEPVSILRETLAKLKEQSFPTKKINIVLAAEAVDPNGVKISKQLKSEFNKYFENIWITNHVLSEEEIIGKSANMAWAGKAVVKEIKKLKWDLAMVTVTSCDADSKLPQEYFSYISYLYSVIPDSKYKFFNGALVLYNNIWRLPFYARVKNSMSTIYNVGRLIRTDKLVPFSTYTTSFWLVDQIGYWTPWVTPEDFHLFFKALFKFNSKVQTIAIYLKIMSDAAEGDTHWETIKNNYLQERRWSWGVSDDGWVLKNILTKWKKYSIRVKYISFHTVFDHIMGPFSSLLILIGGNIPPLINPTFSRQVFGVKLPGISASIVQVTIIMMLIVIGLDFFLKPKPRKRSRLRSITRIVEWIVQPFVGIFLAMIPGLEAHTRLLFGKYLEYYVTKKKGKKKE